MDIIFEVTKLIGVPFHWHGRTEAGLDCLGLILLPLKRLSIVPEEFDFMDYGNRPQNLLLELQTTGVDFLRQIAPSHATHGDILAYPIGGIIAHLAWIDGDDIIHAHQLNGVIRERRKDWAKREQQAAAFEVIIG